MSTVRVFRILALAGLLAAVHNVHAGNGRLLFSNPDYDVNMAESFYCDEPVTVTVRSDRPELFEAEATELQRIVDATQAVLAFECPAFDVIRVEGRLAGLDEPVYAGVAERGNDWELATTQSIQSQAYEQSAAPTGDDEYGYSDGGLGFTVANLSAGMSVDEARAAVTDTFGVESEFDSGQGVLSMRTGGCPVDYDWAAVSPTPERGWKCLSAWFTDQRLARLYLLDLVQVVEAADPQAIEQQLIDRFGEPVYRDTRDQANGWWETDDTIHVLAWGEVVETQDTGSGEQEDIYTLQAKVLPIEDVTIVTVTLYKPGLRPGWASDPDSSAPDLTL